LAERSSYFKKPINLDFNKMIESYSFGRIEVAGREYTHDIIIYPDHVDSGWWRKEGHSLQMEDLRDVVGFRPRLLIIGNGANGRMRVPVGTVEYLKSMGIEVLIKPTKEAAAAYNEVSDKENVVAALHITC
jgi:hypothetical protein